MKKLMILAAAAAMVGGAFADDACTTPCAWAYKFKAIVKTTASSSLSNATTCATGCYRKPAVRRYVGYFFGTTTKTAEVCNPGCGCIDLADSLTSRIAIWNFDTKKPVTPNATLRLADRIGKDDTARCEIVFDAEYYGNEPSLLEGPKTALTFAGFGEVARMASGQPAIRTASGYCAGTVPGVCASCDEVCGVIQPETCVVTPADVLRICGEGVKSYVTAAFGKWKIQWDGEMASRITNQKTVMGDASALSDYGIDTECTGFTPAGYSAGVAKIIKIIFEDEGLED